MSAHAVGVFGVGTDPPPDRMLPRLSFVILDVSASTLARSACVIWPIFSASVMRPSRSSTRCGIGRLASWYGNEASACAACPPAAPTAGAPDGGATRTGAGGGEGRAAGGRTERGDERDGGDGEQCRREWPTRGRSGCVHADVPPADEHLRCATGAATRSAPRARDASESHAVGTPGQWGETRLPFVA